MRPIARLTPVAVVAAALVAAPSAAGLGLPTTFPRIIAITTAKQHIAVAGFQVSFTTVGRNVRVRIRVAASSTDHARKLMIATGRCTGGTLTSPLCPPTARSRVNIPVGGTSWVRAMWVAKPPRAHDAIRVTLTEATHAIPYRPENVGGGGGTGELLINGGTWRYKQGTQWGITTSPTEGVTLDTIKFNSRTYAWSGTAAGELAVHTTIGYDGQTPRWDFANTMKAGVPFSFDRTPSNPIRLQRTAPRTLKYAMRFANEPQFAVTVPLPVWPGG